MVSEKLWKTELDKVQELIRKADIVKTKVHIVDEEHEVSKSLKSFGGIISTLRYPLSF